MKRKLIFASILSIALSGCAIANNEIYKHTDYNDPVFANNYYRVKEKNITDNIKETNSITLEKENNKVFTSYDELKALGSDFDKEVSNNEVTYDSIAHFNGASTYGTSKCLGKIDDSFNHGVLSKLTDGLLFCDGKTYQGVRVQIDQEGFAHEYEKTCVYADYFALSFKPASDYTSDNYPTSATYDIRLNIKFYNQDDNKFVENVYSYTLNNVSRNSYLLFGFELTQNMVKNLKGLGISYDLLNTSEPSSVDHCLLLYETMFVNSIWY